MQALLKYDHYKVLGIPRDATQAEVKRAYRDLVKRCHPDVNPSPKAAAIFHHVHEAYSVLNDPEARDRYDERLRMYREAPGKARRATRSFGRPLEGGYMHHPEAPASRLQRFAYVGLHVTGLLFGLSVVLSILIGIAFAGWSTALLVFSLPGVAAIPASIEGLRN